MKIFADLHHSGLYASLHYLFENRLGYELYRPIGMEWFDKGYWKIGDPYPNPRDTAIQYLRLNSTPSDGSPPLNGTPYSIIDPQMKYFPIPDRNHGFDHRAVTLDQFLELDVDIIIASIPAHIQAYKKLIKDHNLKAKLVYQIGNIGWHNEIPWSQVDNIMASVKAFPIKHSHINAVFYRQEFDLGVFSPNKFVNGFDWRSITSFVNCLPQPDKYNRLKEMLYEYEFKAYGIPPSPDGIVDTIDSIADKMQQTTFGYHNKPHGDGYGHVIHNWFAVGKPVIVNMNDYKDKLAGELLEDGVTCIDMDNRSLETVADIVRDIVGTPGKYEELCNNVEKRFKEVVNFEQNAVNVREFLNKCV